MTRLRPLSVLVLLGLSIAAPAFADTTLVSAVLPSARSVQVGKPATAWAAVINAGQETARQVGVSLATDNFPATFLYQTSDGMGNLVGSANTPVDIAPGAVQYFIIAVTPTEATGIFGGPELSFTFQGINTPPAPVNPGLNTLRVSAASDPPMDLIAIAATCPSDDGMPLTLNVPPGGTGAFAIAVINVGAKGTAWIFGPNVCRTNPQTGQCLTPPSIDRPVDLDTGEVATFSLFVSDDGHRPIPSFDPASHRFVVRFYSQSFFNHHIPGFVLGETSVAYRLHSPACVP